MTKRIVSVLVLFLIAGYFFIKKEQTPAVSSHLLTPSAKVQEPSPVMLSEPKVNSPARLPASRGYANAPTKEWEALLTSSLKAQAGNTLKEIKIVKEKSLIWTRDEIPLHVQSVKVSMTNTQDVQSSFNALVDSQTGKILETWNQSIFDPANVREGFRFKLDPRYSN